jgi:hypothetical protein
MAVYTKQELLAAFCEVRNITGTAEEITEALAVAEADIAANLASQKVKIETRLANLPTAKGRMKRLALQHLAKAEKLQSIADNENVNL